MVVKSAGNPIVITSSRVFPGPISENEGLILSPCALDMEDRLKGDPEHVSLFERQGMALQSRSHNLPSISSCEYCWGIVSAAAMRATGCSHGEAETGFQGGWRHVDKHTIGDGLGARV